MSKNLGNNYKLSDSAALGNNYVLGEDCTLGTCTTLGSYNEVGCNCTIGFSATISKASSTSLTLSAPCGTSLSVSQVLATMPVPGDVVNVIVGPIWEPYVAEIVWDGCVSTLFEKGLIWATREEAETALAAFAKGYR